MRFVSLFALVLTACPEPAKAPEIADTDKKEEAAAPAAPAEAAPAAPAEAAAPAAEAAPAAAPEAAPAEAPAAK